ncbi:hypothetical protein DPEC_G00175630 [Dallia pectoralis]|uniref:Uncharacterized protein n=1 Tax=Dallia pectoralis TaxID=75939 RepID=A0ACC2GEL9_DALPE|nr:hypothetical protein DPEC_G00175630 [Dallia pectoralis]
MKYSQLSISQSMGIKAYSPKESIISSCGRTPSQIKPIRSVHFPNDIVFRDYVRQGELDRVDLFIRKKRVNLDTIYQTGMAAIHEAVLSGNLECVKLLVKHGADIHQRDEEGWTPLHMAVSDSFPGIAKYLVSIGADPQARNDCGETPADLMDPECTGFRELQALFGVEDD